jgi:hypothetical protein
MHASESLAHAGPHFAAVVCPTLRLETAHGGDGDVFLGRQQTAFVATGQALVAHETGDVRPLLRGGFVVERLVFAGDGLGDGGAVGGEEGFHVGHGFDDLWSP